MAKSQAVATKDPAEIALLQRVADLVSAIPEAGGDGTAFIMRWLDVESASDMISDDTESQADDLDDLLGDDIRVDSVTRWASDYYEQAVKEGKTLITDQYVIVHGYDVTRNQDVVFAVGAATPIVKLSKLHKFGAFPATVRFARSLKPTNQGYYPMNMSVLTVTERETVDA